MIGEKCIVRTYSAGVFYGVVEKMKGREALVSNARRLWYWDGAASLSEMAVRGVSRPKNCKFPVAVPSVRLTEVIEVLPCTAAACESIEAVAEWSHH